MEEFKIEHRRRNSDTSDISFVSHRSMDPPLAFKRDVNRLAVKRSRRDATLINPGPPAVYQLKTQRECINEKVRQWTYGQRDSNKQNNVILMVGETGAGKTTLINTMINHLLGVKFEDQEFYQITEEQQEQTQSQTSEITVYKVFVEENPTSLTIIDTPGYTNTKGFKREREIAEYLSRLFANRVRDIDAVCFVMKASQNRLSGKELYIFHAVLSLFGRDIEDNIVFLLTHLDGGPPRDALNAIDKAEIPCRRDEDNEPVHFLFNNRQKEKRDKQYENLFKSAWGIGERSMNELLKLLEENNRRSFRITVPAVKELRQLEGCVYDLMERITEKELKMQELTDIQEALTLNRDKIEKGENFEFTVRKVFKSHVFCLLKATSCKTCEMTCHSQWGCWWVSTNELFKCDVMKDNHCTVCPGKCHYTIHVKEHAKYVKIAKTIQMTFNELIKKYACTGEKSEIKEKLTIEKEQTKTQKSILLNEAYRTLMILSKAPLEEAIDFTPEHVDFFIDRLKEEEESMDRWIQDLNHVWRRIKDLRNNWGHWFGIHLQKIIKRRQINLVGLVELQDLQYLSIIGTRQLNEIIRENY